MTLPACLQYNDANGNPVTELRLDLFASLIANQVCTNLASINLINSTLTSFSSRLDILEACVLPCSGTVAEVQIIPTCVSTVGVLTNVSAVVLALESEFCALRDAVGTVALITQAINQTTITGSTTTLSNNSVSYGSINGWNPNPPTLAQSVQNAWIVIDDMYNAIADIQNNCCPSGCDSVVFASTAATSYDMTTGLIGSIIFNFTGSTIPAGFNDCSGYSKITITDALGASLTQQVSVASLQNSSSGYTFNLGSLRSSQDLSVSIEYCVTDGTDTCESTIGSTISGYVPCPGSVSLSGISQTEMTVNFNNTLGTNASYLLEVLDAAGSSVIQTYTINSPGATPSHTFTGLTPGTNYNLRITVTYEGGTAVCPLNSFNTQTGTAPCSDGMDVAFVIDYTYSMASAVNGVKAGVASLVNTIDTSSGANDYRLSLITVDEYAQGTTPLPAYAACTDYTNLPAAQKYDALGTNNSRQIISAWELFQNNNGPSFTTELNKLNGGATAGCVQIGNGSGTAEPCDLASQLVVNSNFTGAFRANVAKYIIIITDNLPSGTEDTFTAQTWAGIQLSLIHI